ncbi:MAG TPA: hypothetical protein VK550_27870 [Polyangiaceae bacterium]|jgi:hypothetical protein|nr:hypothetical protein [Polyangiaceae bacterium]
MNRLTKTSTILGWLTTSTAVLLTCTHALAQDATVGVGATTTIPSRTRANEPGEGRPATTTVTGSSAHEAAVGRLGVGWFGTRDVPVGPATMATTGPIPTPIIGIRYWLGPMLGIDAGLGFFTASSATRNEATTNITIEGPTRTSFLLHAGVPLALADAGNFTFLVIPEFNLGIGTGGTKASMGNPSTDLSGLLIEGGVRAGAEVFFGFIGIPQLSLEGTVGAFLSSATGKLSQGGGSTRFSTFVFSTSSVAQPWDIFRKDIAARYYF